MSKPKAGRPEGKGNPGVAERIKRSLPRIYEAARVAALAGDSGAARLCVDIAKHPEAFPLSDKRP